MPTTQQENISNIEALISSIMVDSKVYQWFSFLLNQSELKTRLKNDENTNKLSSQLTNHILKQKILYFLILATLIIGIASNYFLIILLITLLLYLISTRLRHKRKQLVAQISRSIISSDFQGQELTNKTLFQICEIYSQRYSIPSLVDAIYHSDRILRYAIISIIVIQNFIWPIYNDIQNDIFLIAFCLVINALLKTDFVYKRLK